MSAYEILGDSSALHQQPSPQQERHHQPASHHHSGTNADVEDPWQAKPKYDWSKKITCAACGCFSFLQQLVLVAALGSFLFGFNLSLMNTAISYVAWEFGWCDYHYGNEDIDGCTRAKNYKAFVSVGVFVGAAIGSMTGGVFLAFGRRGMILLSMAMFVLGTICSLVAANFASLFWARLVCGYAVGLVSVCVPTYMSEVTPAKVRGFYGVFHQLFITVGIVFGTLFGLPLALKEPIPLWADVVKDGKNMIPDLSTFSKVWWRVMQGINFIPIALLILLLGFVYTFETPHYYIEKKQRADAEQLLMRITDKKDVSEELAQIEQDLSEAAAAQAAGMSLRQAMKRADFRWVIFFGCLLSAFQQFGGINVFIASSNDLFTKAGLKGKWPTIMSNIMNIVNCVMTIPAVPLIERLGRRTLLLIGTCGMTIGVAPAAICYWALGADSDVTMYLAIIGCMVFIICFAATYGPILWVYLFEIYPTEIKGAAAGLATAVNWVAGIIMVFVTAYLENRVSYLLFMIMCGISFVLVLMWMKETKGLPLGESPFVVKA